MDNDEPGNIRTLRRIAGALGVPVETLFAPVGHGEAARPPSADEVRRLLAAFMTVADPQVRGQIIDSARRAARAAGCSTEKPD